MKPLAWLVVVVLFVSASRADDKKDAPKEDPIKVGVDQLEKAHGIKFKSVTLVKDNKPAASQTRVLITLDFTKDVADPKALKDLFLVHRDTPTKFDNLPLVFHLFDADNVSLGKYVIQRMEGDLTGVKGDAFRVLIVCDTETFNKAKKIEARMLNPPKPEK